MFLLIFDISSYNFGIIYMGDLFNDFKILKISNIIKKLAYLEKSC